MKKNDFWNKVRKVLLNKYAITVFIFAVLLIFVGEQSFINQFSRAIEVREIKQDIQQTKAETAKAEQILQSLEDPDSLERFAREQYHMHTDGEVVYIVE